ncbi:MAG: phage holin, LLH family [Flexilinea sp.]
MEITSIFVQELLKQLLPWLASLLVAVIVKVAGDLWLNFKSSQPDKATTLQKVAEMAVYAAEQAKLQDAIEDKKNWALEFAQDFLVKNYGLKLDLTAISNAIEAEVRKMNQISEPVILDDRSAGG